jgi:hypothetical protein
MGRELDFTGAQRLYLAVVIGAGVGTALWSGVELYVRPVSGEWFILAALTPLTGSFTVRMKKLSIRIIRIGRIRFCSGIAVRNCAGNRHCGG